MPSRTIVCVVEGYGEEAAVPVLLRRIGAELAPHVALSIKSWRVHAGKIFGGNWSDIDRAINFARAHTCDSVLLLLDTDCEPARCPMHLGSALRAEVTARASGLKVGLVLAHCEFETWFIAAIESLRGVRGLQAGLRRPADPETIRGAKEWLSRHLPHCYSETLDQPAFAHAMDLQQARTFSRSFRKFWREVNALLH